MSVGGNPVVRIRQHDSHVGVSGYLSSKQTLNSYETYARWRNVWVTDAAARRPTAASPSVSAMWRESEQNVRFYGATCNHCGYVQYPAPEISDAAYDELFRELRALEDAQPELIRPDSPTQRVGGAPLNSFPTVEHAAPMMSLESDADEEALYRFDRRVRDELGDERTGYVVEPKLDGLSIELVYERGLLTRASTRGGPEEWAVHGGTRIRAPGN